MRPLFIHPMRVRAARYVRSLFPAGSGPILAVCLVVAVTAIALIVHGLAAQGAL